MEPSTSASATCHTRTTKMCLYVMLKPGGVLTIHLPTSSWSNQANVGIDSGQKCVLSAPFPFGSFWWHHHQTLTYPLTINITQELLVWCSPTLKLPDVWVFIFVQDHETLFSTTFCFFGDTFVTAFFLFPATQFSQEWARRKVVVKHSIK